jgi:meiotically up-regulated gene 157 (Mug157) protein
VQVDGFGNAFFMDDANIPSLLGMPYYSYVNDSDSLYQNTRKAVLSSANPWYLNGTAGSGIGGPHNGWPYIWPMAIIMQGWTAQTDAEVLQVLNTLTAASACTGLVHESFNVVCAHPPNDTALRTSIACVYAE